MSKPSSQNSLGANIKERVSDFLYLAFSPAHEIIETDNLPMTGISLSPEEKEQFMKRISQASEEMYKESADWHDHWLLQD